MKRIILLFASIILSVGFLTGCADVPLEDEIEVGYSTVDQPVGGRMDVARWDQRGV